MNIESYIGASFCFILSFLGSVLALTNSLHLLSDTFLSIFPYLTSWLIGLFGFINTLVILTNIDSADGDALLIAGIVSGVSNLISGSTIYLIIKNADRSSFALFCVLISVLILGFNGLVVSVVIINKST